MNLEKKIWELSEEYLEDSSHYIVDVSVSKGGKKNIAIYIDSDKGSSVKIEDCSSLSKKLSNHFEVEDFIEGAYVLEVSSAGMGNPFKIARQYQKNLGREVQVIEKDGKESKGILSGMGEDNISLEIHKKKGEVLKKMIPLESIKQTKLVITI